MRKNFDKILLGILWLLMVVLATTFWLNVRYGFNLFSGAHWAYLSELQAKRAAVQPDFYMSLIGGILIGLIGLYLLLRPRQVATQTPEPTEHVPTPPAYNNGGIFNSRPMSPLGNRPQTIQPTAPKFTLPQTHSVTPPPAPTQPAVMANPLAPEIRNILESAGYTIKKCEKINDILSPVVTLGYNQTLYIITSNAKVSDLESSINTLSALFQDTLGDTADDINISGIMIHPSDTADAPPEQITIFQDIDAFGQFMSDKSNTQTEDYDPELFEAMDTYINTVMGYLGKN